MSKRRQRIVELFGKAYWWDLEDGKLTLRPAKWINNAKKGK